jgi:thermostable 8-oxoguanine DNA glycosylase
MPKISAIQQALDAIALIEQLHIPIQEEATPDEALKLIRKAQYRQKKYEKDQVKDAVHRATHVTERVRRPESPWVAHVKQVQEAEGISYKDALQEAKKSYRK